MPSSSPASLPLTFFSPSSTQNKHNSPNSPSALSPCLVHTVPTPENALPFIACLALTSLKDLLSRPFLTFQQDSTLPTTPSKGRYNPQQTGTMSQHSFRRYAGLGHRLQNPSSPPQPTAGPMTDSLVWMWQTKLTAVTNEASGLNSHMTWMPKEF